MWRWEEQTYCENVLDDPVFPVQLPTYGEPEYEPSYREPIPRPFSDSAQSVDANDHSPTISQRGELAYVGP